MKTLTASYKTVLLLFITLFAISCSDDDNDTITETPATISTLASETPELSNLYAALERAGLVDDLDTAGKFTVFAPTNNAFNAFLSDNNFASLNDVPVDVLTQVLLNHVIPDLYSSSNLDAGYKSTLATENSTGNNLSMYITTESGVTLNGASRVVTPDISASNGYVHLVDEVIPLPTVVDFATTNEDFSILVSALTRSDLTFDYVGTLSTPNGTDPAPFTVFAPTNQAFVDLLSELGVSSLNDIDEPTLKATLDLHAVAGANVLSSSLSDDMTVTTLGGNITANVSGGATLTDANGRVSKIVVVDVQATNGVIHVIDKVVLPEMPSTISGKVSSDANLSSLFAALQAADGDLVSTLNGSAEFTLLAPSNDAFAAFLTENNFSALSEVPTDILAQVLLNHVITGSVSSNDLVTSGSGYAKTNATGAGDMNMSIFYNATNGVMFNGISSVTSADVEATNGVIHMVDKVIALPSVVDHAAANPSFSNLVAALSAADGDLVNVLNGEGPFTVLAPVNDGFTSFLSDNNFNSLGDVPTDALSQVLLNHVMAGTTFSTDLVAAGSGYTTTSASAVGENAMSIYYNTSNGVMFNGISTVALPDVVASNGVIHAVDKVIGLPTVVDFALADPNFSILVEALTRSDLTTDYVDILSTPNGTSPAPFTVFAPTNTAFASLLDELKINGLSDITEPTLNAALSYHAVAEMNVRSSDLSDNMTVPTLGGNITANVTGGATLEDANGRVSNIIAVDVQASNGVIHAIDKVVLPPL